MGRVKQSFVSVSIGVMFTILTLIYPLAKDDSETQLPRLVGGYPHKQATWAKCLMQLGAFLQKIRK
jgi:hypothetical protein